MTRRQKPYADPVGLVRVLERHEAQIARHTAIQSKIAAWQLFVGSVTTLALIYVAYQQYRASDRQVSLEYAKVAPQFKVTTAPFDRMKGAYQYQSFPKSIKIRLSRGEAEIEKIEYFQDIDTTIIDEQEKHHSCLLRSSGYFAATSNNQTDIAAKVDFAKIANEPFAYYAGKNFYLFYAKSTWVRITFRDIFGDTRSLAFGGDSGRLEQLPSTDFGTDSISEVAEARIRPSPLSPPFIFEGNKGGLKTEGCKRVLSEFQPRSR